MAPPKPDQLNDDLNRLLTAVERRCKLLVHYRDAAGELVERVIMPRYFNELGSLACSTPEGEELAPIPHTRITKWRIAEPMEIRAAADLAAEAAAEIGGPFQASILEPTERLSYDALQALLARGRFEVVLSDDGNVEVRWGHRDGAHSSAVGATVTEALERAVSYERDR
jgi:hypothetical protein